MIRTMRRYMARLRMEEAGIKKCVKKGFFRNNWRDYVYGPRARRLR